jgi:hypothetical protein
MEHKAIPSLNATTVSNNNKYSRKFHASIHTHTEHLQALVHIPVGNASTKLIEGKHGGAAM